MTALVTGGAGFIGSHLADALASRGDRVRVLDDLSTGRRENLRPDADFIHASVVDRAALDRAMKGVTTVFHLAAVVSVQECLLNPAGSCEVNITGTVRVLQAAAAAGVRRVVFAMQRHMAPADEGRQRSPAAGLVRSGLLDPGETDFAAVIKAKAAPVDHGGDAAFALRLERAIGVRLSASGQHEKCRNNGLVTPCRIGRYAAHSGCVPVCSTPQCYQR